MLYSIKSTAKALFHSETQTRMLS